MALTRINPVREASGNGWQARKYGGVVELRLDGLESSAILPAGFTPTVMTYVPVSAQQSGGYTPRVAVNPAGNLTPQGYTGKAYGIATYRTT